MITDVRGERLIGKHELLNYDHGRIPFVHYTQERRSRKIDDSRGYGEIASTWQGQIKAEWDNEALVVAFEMVDPNLGERLLKPAESASLHEIDDEQTVALKLLAGQGVPVQPGQAFQLRLQTLMNFLQNSQAAQKMLLSNAQAQEAVKQRAKDLQFQIQQQQNAVIGRGGPAFTPKLAAKD